MVQYLLMGFVSFVMFLVFLFFFFFFFSSRRRHTRLVSDWSSDVCSSDLEAWAYRIVVRECRSEARRLRRSGVSVVDLSESMAAAGDAFGEVDRRDALGRAFDRLSQDHRAVVVLHHLAALPLAEVAEILDVPYGTVGSRLHLAIREVL